MGKIIAYGVDCGGSASDANKINYNDTNTSLGAENVQSAIESVDTKVEDINSALGTTDISSIGDGTVTGGLSTLNSNLKRTNNVLALNSNHGEILSVNCNYYENGIYHIDVSINITTEVPSSGQIVSLTKNGQSVTFTRRLDAAFESTDGRYNICLLPNTNTFFANGLKIPVGFYKLKIDVSE